MKWAGHFLLLTADTPVSSGRHHCCCILPVSKRQKPDGWSCLDDRPLLGYGFGWFLGSTHSRLSALMATFFPTVVGEVAVKAPAWVAHLHWVATRPCNAATAQIEGFPAWSSPDVINAVWFPAHLDDPVSRCFWCFVSSRVAAGSVNKVLLGLFSVLHQSESGIDGFCCCSCCDRTVWELSLWKTACS